MSLITADDYSVESDSFASAPFLFRAVGLTATALCRQSWSGLSDLCARIFEYPATGFSACSIKRGDAIGANFARTRRKRERSHGLVLSSFFDVAVPSLHAGSTELHFAGCWIWLNYNTTRTWLSPNLLLIINFLIKSIYFVLLTFVVLLALL